jgi:hypothetical protein
MALTRTRSVDSRRISSLLVERRVSEVAMIAVLAMALLFGLIGFALHVFWVASVVVLALGLGYVLANGRQDRVEVLNRRQQNSDSVEQLP